MANMMACFLGVTLTAVATATQMATPELASGEAETGARNPGLEQQLRTTLLSHLDPNVPPYTDGVSGVSVATQVTVADHTPNERSHPERAVVSVSHLFSVRALACAASNLQGSQGRHRLG